MPDKEPFLQDEKTDDVLRGRKEGPIDSVINFVEDVFTDEKEISEPSIVEPERTFPAPAMKEQPSLEDTRLPFMVDGPLVGGNPEVAGQPGFFRAVSNEVQDFGFTSTMLDVINDATALDDQDLDFKDMQSKVNQLMITHDLPDSFREDILNMSVNADQAEAVIIRTKRMLERMPAREQMGVGKSLAVGLTGFLADPANLLPAALLVKVGGASARLLGYQALKEKLKLEGTTVAVAEMATFGAVEEAFRTAPRLQSDATFGYEQYVAQIGYGALLGGGIIGAVPLGKFALSKTSRAVSDTITGLADAVVQAATIRTGVNTVVAASKASVQAFKNKSVATTLKAADVGATIREARNKATEQIRDHKILRSVDETVESFKSQLKTFDGDHVVAFAASIKNVVREAMPDNKFKESIDKLAEKIDNIGKKPEPKSAGSAARKETPETKVGDAAQDMKDSLKGQSKSIKETMDNISAIEKEALVALSEVPGTLGRSARQGVRAAALSARNAVEAKATREGIKTKRKVLTEEATTAYMIDVVRKALNTSTRKELNNILIKLGLDDKISLDSVIRNINERLEVSGVKGGDLSEGIINWINSNPKLAKFRTTRTRDAIQREHIRAREHLEDVYTGNPADKDFLRAKRILSDSQDNLEAITDWIGMLNSDRYNDLAKLDPRWALLSREYEDSMGATNRAILQEQYQKLAQRFISKQFGSLTESLSAKLVRTGVPLAEWMALNILELPAGAGGKIARNETAAITSQIMEAEIQVPLNKAWVDMMDEAAADLGYGRIKRMLLRTQGANTSDLVKDVARKVMLEMNGRQMGISTFDSIQPNYVKRFADRLEEANSKAYALQLEHNIDGITGANKMKSYMKQSWNDGAIMENIQNPSVGKAGVVELLGKSLHMRAGDQLTRKEAADLAESVIATKIDAMNKPQVDSFSMSSENLPNAMAAIDEILEHMNKNGKQGSIESVLKYVAGKDGGGPGYVNKRFLNLDYNAQISKNGKVISVMDLLDNDVIANANRYNKEAAGRSAVSKASGGRLTSDQEVNDFIGATGTQATELGTYVNTADMRNVFKQIMGLPFDGALHMNARKIRDGVSLAGMNGLGESQLAELGLAVNRGLAGLFGTNQVISKTVGQAKQFMGMQLTDKQKANTKFLGELQEFSRLYENMHHLARNNVHFDTRANQDSQGVFSKLVDTATGGKYRPTLQYLQTRATAYSAIRTMEEQIAMAGLMQDAVKAVKSGNAFTSSNRFTDIGLDINLIKKKIDDGSIILNKDGTIESLNMERWSNAENYTLGVALRRHSGQQVQMAFAGEMSSHMTNPHVAFLMQFKSYPMLAAEKQMGRHAMFGDKEAAMGITLNAASSAAARYVRYMSLSMALPEERRERYVNRRLERDFAHDTAAYMGIVGMMVNSHDLVREVGFGNSSVADQIPVTNWADNYLSAVKSAGNIGDLDERDLGNMQRGAPIGTIAQVNVLAGILRTMMETDSEREFIRQPQNRGN